MNSKRSLEGLLDKYPESHQARNLYDEVQNAIIKEGLVTAGVAVAGVAAIGTLIGVLASRRR